MLPLLLVTGLTAAAPLQLASPGFHSRDLRVDEISYYSEFFANQLRLAGVKIFGADELASAVTPQREKQLVQCQGEACGSMADLQHLQLDGVVQGKISRQSSGYQLDITFLDAATAEPLSVRSVQSHSEDELQESLRRLAREMAVDLFSRTGKLPAPQPEVELAEAPGQPTSPLPGGLIMLAGAVATGTGIALNQVARGQLADVRIGFELNTYAEARAHAQGARNISIVSIVCIGVGAAAIVAGAIWAAVSVTNNRKLSVFAFSDGHTGSFGLAGAF